MFMIMVIFMMMIIIITITLMITTIIDLEEQVIVLILLPLLVLLLKIQVLPHFSELFDQLVTDIQIAMDFHFYLGVAQSQKGRPEKKLICLKSASVTIK